MVVIGSGVPVGASNPCIVSDSWSGKPASASVGASGSAGDRVPVVTASARNLPSCTCGTTGVSTTNAMGVCPARTDWTAGAEPLKGTDTRSRFCECLNISPPSWDVVPTPGCAILYLPGLERRNAISSLTVVAGIDGLTTSTFGDAAARVTGAKSLVGLYGIFG